MLCQRPQSLAGVGYFQGSRRGRQRPGPRGWRESRQATPHSLPFHSPKWHIPKLAWEHLPKSKDYNALETRATTYHAVRGGEGRGRVCAQRGLGLKIANSGSVSWELRGKRMFSFPPKTSSHFRGEPPDSSTACAPAWRGLPLVAARPGAGTNPEASSRGEAGWTRREGGPTLRAPWLSAWTSSFFAGFWP